MYIAKFFLSEIQDLYEDTLLDERKSITQKTVETRRLVDLWEKDPPLGRPKDAPLAAAVLFFLHSDRFCCFKRDRVL